MDFAFFRNFSYGCKQVFSAERWALTGEAGLFLDPFYSPGSDFIAIANTYICELVERDRAGRPLEAHAQIYDQIFHSFYESTLALYTGQYPIFGDPEVLPVKVIWDYTYYWGVLSQFFFQRRLADLAAFSDLKRRAGALPGAQRRGAGAAARLVGGAAARDRAQPGGDARPGVAALVRRASTRACSTRLDDAGLPRADPPFDAADAQPRGGDRRARRGGRRRRRAGAAPAAGGAASRRRRGARCRREPMLFATGDRSRAAPAEEAAA